jgi:hypothetical protein
VVSTQITTRYSQRFFFFFFFFFKQALKAVVIQLSIVANM